MGDSEELDKLLEEEDIEVEDSSPESIKRKVRVVEEELGKLSDIQWGYAKRLLAFGISAWIFGVAAFVASLFLYEGPGLIMKSPAVSFALLILAGAIPIIITIILIQKYRKRMSRLEQIRDGLLSQYEKVLLKKVEENIA